MTREAALSVTADAVPAPPQGEPRRSKKPVIARPIPLVKGKCPEGTKGIGLAGIAAGDDWKIPSKTC